MSQKIVRWIRLRSWRSPADLATCTVTATPTGVTVDSETGLRGTLAGGMSGSASATYAIRIAKSEQSPCTGTMRAAVIVVPNLTISSVDRTTACAPNSTLTIDGTV